MVIAALFLSGCGFGASETSGFKGGKTEYKDVPTEITSFMWQEWSDMPVHGYLIERRSSGNCICLEGNVNERESMTEWDIDDSVMDELADWVDDYNIREWDGFDMDKDNRVPSAGFELVIELGTGEKINATGKNVYPKDYDAARNYLMELLSDMPLAANEKSADKEASDGGYTSTYYEEDNYSEPVRSDDLGDMDGDGINDIFEIKNLLEGGCYTDNELYIYNHWGRLIYHKKNISTKEEFWDPALNNERTGTYYYRFSAKGHIGNIQRNGVIELIK